MSDEIERHVLKKYDVVAKLGKGVRAASRVAIAGGDAGRARLRADLAAAPCGGALNALGA